jgi:hypothetical protein
MFNQQLRDVLRKGEQTLVHVFNGANSGKLNDAQQLAAMQYIHYMNDEIMKVFSNPQVQSAETPKGPDTVSAPEKELSAEMGFEDQSPEVEVAPQVETAKVKEMMKDAVTVADDKEESRALQREKDSGVGAKGKVKKK